MQFKSEAERMQHPQAKLIPASIWYYNFCSFNTLIIDLDSWYGDFFEGNIGDLPDAFTILMQADEDALIPKIDDMQKALAPGDKLGRMDAKRCVWIAIALSHPTLSHTILCQISQLLGINNKDLFILAAIVQNSPFFESLVAEHTKTGILEEMIVAGNYTAFDWAAQNSHLPLMERLMELAPAKVQDMIASNDYQAFRKAAKKNHQPIIERLIELAPAKVQDMIAANDYDAFRESAANGNLLLMDSLIELAPTKAEDMIKAYSYRTYRLSAINGHMIAQPKYEAFRRAAENGHFSIVNRLLSFSAAFAYAESQPGKYDEKYLYPFISSHLTNLRLKQMQVAQDIPNAVLDSSEIEETKLCFYILRNLIRRNDAGLLDDIRFLLNIPAVKSLTDISVMRRLPNELLRLAITVDNQAAVALLLTIPIAFAYAEAHNREYGEQYVHPFIKIKLSNLRTKKTEVEEETPSAVFDIVEMTEAKICFYMLRNLIRRNDAGLLDDIRFLLDIPAVKALAHTPVTPGMPNEPLRIALSIGHTPAAGLLLTIPAIHDLARQNNYYRNEARRGMDLTALAQDRESSMRALSTGEQKRLQAALSLYEPQIKQAGVQTIMDDLQKNLAQHYAMNPAKMTQDNGFSLILPLHWNAFQELSLTDTEKKAALHAYYQHKPHTAWRYLSKPNPWIHEHASYVCVSDDRTQRWSTFEEYQPLIAMLYLAAIDKDIAPIDGYTLETRLEQLIDGLAQIGRAHNWDNTRMKRKAEGNPISEEYDDLDDDRPSCSSGVKGRLVQSIQGHPLFKMLTKEAIHQELGEFVLMHFKGAITKDNRAMLKEAWDNYIDVPNTIDLQTLKVLDISPPQQKSFTDFLTSKYGAQFTEDAGFIKQVELAFKLDDKEAHAIQFGYVHISRLLETPATVTLSHLGFFADSMKQQENEGPSYSAANRQ